MDRKSLMKLIHIAKDHARICPDCDRVLYSRRCPDCRIETATLSEERYRSILESFGASSCRFLDDSGLEKVYSFFLHAGFKPRPDPEKVHSAGRRKSIGVAISMARNLFGEEMWEKRLMGFVRKAIGKESLYECDDSELRKAIGWLRRYSKYLSKRGEERRR